MAHCFQAGERHIAAMHNDTAAAARSASDNVRLILLEGIACRRVVRASYNRQELMLAPHLLFARRGELFVSALNLSKAWRSSQEMRLGNFKVLGLTEAEVTDEPFKALDEAQRVQPSPEDELFLAVE